MKKLFLTLAVVAFTASLGLTQQSYPSQYQQTPQRPQDAGVPVVPSTDTNTFIKGTMNIQFNSCVKVDSNGNPLPGVRDVYTTDFNVCNSAHFSGTISDLPYLPPNKTLGFGFAGQNEIVSYDMSCGVYNPHNMKDMRIIGAIQGVVPIDPSGMYRYDIGNLHLYTKQIGMAAPIDSKFDGTVQGKVLAHPTVGWIQGLQAQVMSVTKLVKGHTTTITLKKYDKLVFHDHKLPAGPIGVYNEVTVNGEMAYDYDRKTWFFNSLTLTYSIRGQVYQDRLNGDIQWNPAPDRGATGLGAYAVDIHVNEPPDNGETAFASSSDDESSFFQVDNSIPALTGSISYHDTLVDTPDKMAGTADDANCTASDITYDLHGNLLHKQQVMAIGKLILFSAIKPMNSN